MEIRNDAEALKSFLGVQSTPSAATHAVRSGDAANVQAAFAGDQATFSRAATEVSQAADDSAVRMEKVTAVQQALASGTYSIPSAVVAGKVMDAMLNGGLGSGN